MQIDDRHVIEVSFHDRMVGDHDTRGGYFYDWGLSSEAVRCAREALGELEGKQILDYGCGAGDEALWLASQGAQVSAIDISAQMVQLTQQRADAAGLGGQVCAIKMVGEDLKFEAGAFDLVYGVSVIHHVALELAGPEIHRVLKLGGKAVFVEPLIYNPMINLFRKLTPQRRSQTEKPLTYEQIKRLAAGFQELRTREFNLTNMVAIVFPQKLVFRAVLWMGTKVDRFLLRVFPILRRYCWLTVIEMVK